MCLLKVLEEQENAEKKLVDQGEIIRKVHFSIRKYAQEKKTVHNIGIAYRENDSLQKKQLKHGAKILIEFN